MLRHAGGERARAYGHRGPCQPQDDYSHIRIEAKRAALDAIAKPVSEPRVAQKHKIGHTRPLQRKPPSLTD